MTITKSAVSIHIDLTLNDSDSDNDSRDVTPEGECKLASPAPKRTTPAEPLLQLDEVDKVKRHKWGKTGLVYLVSWVGYPNVTDDSWVAEEDAQGAKEALNKYWESLPENRREERSTKPPKRIKLAAVSKKRVVEVGGNSKHDGDYEPGSSSAPNPKKKKKRMGGADITNGNRDHKLEAGAEVAQETKKNDPPTPTATTSKLQLQGTIPSSTPPQPSFSKQALTVKEANCKPLQSAKALVASTSTALSSNTKEQPKKPKGRPRKSVINLKENIEEGAEVEVDDEITVLPKVSVVKSTDYTANMDWEVSTSLHLHLLSIFFLKSCSC